MVRGQAPGEGAVIKRDRNGGGELLSGGQSAGYLPGRTDSHRADRSGTDLAQELGVSQRRVRWAALREGQQGEGAGGGAQRQQPLPPRDRGCPAPRARPVGAHCDAPSGSGGWPAPAYEVGGWSAGMAVLEGTGSGGPG